MNLRDQFAEYLTAFEPETSLETDDQPVTDYLRATMLAGIRDVAPGASLAAHATVRLTGPRFVSGVFDSAAAKIFTHLDREIRAAVPPAAADSIQLGFRSVGTGSVVLALEPFDTPSGVDEPLPGMAAPAPAEHAFRRVIELHRRLEHAADVGDEYSSGFLRRVKMLVEALDEVDGGIEIALSAADGNRVRSHLSEQGRMNAHRFFERTPDIEIQIVNGYLNGVTIKDEFAQVELKHGRSRIEIVQVPAGIAKGLIWDRLLHIRVRTVTVTDRLSRESRHEFVGIDDSGEQ